MQDQLFRDHGIRFRIPKRHNQYLFRNRNRVPSKKSAFRSINFEMQDQLFRDHGIRFRIPKRHNQYLFRNRNRVPSKKICISKLIHRNADIFLTELDSEFQRGTISTSLENGIEFSQKNICISKLILRNAEEIARQSWNSILNCQEA